MLDARRQILHVDMDAFFASVEVLDDPTLRGKAVVVGGPARRGVVAAASYEARVFGVRSAMPMAEALRRCPKLLVVPPRGDRYAEVSNQVFDVFHRYTPLVEGLSIDEAFLDVTASRSLFGDGEAIAKRIRADVRDVTGGLTCSAGVAESKFVAKIASDMKKPDGLTVVPADVAAFLAPLPIERMWGVGPKTAPTLRALGYETLGDIAKADPIALERAIGQWGIEIRQLARGHDLRAVVPDRDAKSIGAECTYEHDLTTREEIARTLLAHASRCAERLTENALAAGAVVVKLKHHDFTLVTRRKTLDSPANDATSIHEACLELLARFPLDGARIRLTGVQAQDLRSAEPEQKALFRDEREHRRRELQSVLLRAKERFGSVEAPLTFATLLEDTTPRTAPEGDLEKKGSWSRRGRRD
ncbi:MAG: DNA polymerase IV [Labilithrix sp.]|nr:DNA polymerase IV [Labilithrix sp.]MCW5811310.1 DNA polymerase IV [Labilithrix sp.]